MQKKFEKKYFFLETIASELAAINCLYQEQNTSDRQPMC